jgi:hypothetical protein
MLVGRVLNHSSSEVREGSDTSDIEACGHACYVCLMAGLCFVLDRLQCSEEYSDTIFRPEEAIHIPDSSAPHQKAMQYSSFKD